MDNRINFEEAKNKALEFLKSRGPSIPADIAKEIGVPLLFASALLSQLVSEKVVGISHVKIGGSPLYYIIGEKSKLKEFIQKLPSLEREVCEKLRHNKILFDENLSLAEKVALRNLKDFAVPLSVKIKGEKKIFWRWYELSKEEYLREIGEFVKDYLKGGMSEYKEIKEERELKLEKGRKAEEARVEREIKEVKRTVKTSEFIERVKRFLLENKVRILEEKVIRKNREIEFILELNSSLGRINFFAIAKNKKVLNPAELALAYYRSQEKKLPLILINSGRFTKKAEEKARELGITIKSLEKV